MTGLYQWISTGFHQHSPEAPDVYNLELGSSKLSSNKHRSSTSFSNASLDSAPKSSLYPPYHTEACKELGGSSPRISAGQHSSEETSQRWRHCAEFTGPLSVRDSRTSRTDSVRLATELTASLDSALLLYSRKFRQKNNKTCLKCSEW